SGEGLAGFGSLLPVAQKLGAVAVLHKPFDGATPLEAVQAALGGAGVRAPRTTSAATGPSPGRGRRSTLRRSRGAQSFPEQPGRRRSTGATSGRFLSGRLVLPAEMRRSAALLVVSIFILLAGILAVRWVARNGQWPVQTPQRGSSCRRVSRQCAGF